MTTKTNTANRAGTTDTTPAPATTTPASAVERAAETERTRAVVAEYLRRVSDPEQGPEEIAAMYAEEVDWQIAPNPAVPWIRPRSTRADVVGHWVELAAHTVPEAGGASIDAFLVDGADAVLTGHVYGTLRATGKSFHSPFALRLTVANGEIVRHHIYEDSLGIAAACTPDQAEPAA
ncbi:nuclear transport factor 2 family protein [Streptomyces buecherae]|uniref:nuclear transport factor 2 family protein n=1 Tax=Streptomyces buecherae TaxID=2763006 RepID=UPI0033E18499